MSADKYPSIFSRQMATIVYLVSDTPQFQLGNIRLGDAFRPIARWQNDLMDYNGS